MPSLCATRRLLQLSADKLSRSIRIAQSLRERERETIQLAPFKFCLRHIKTLLRQDLWVRRIHFESCYRRQEEEEEENEFLILINAGFLGICSSTDSWGSSNQKLLPVIQREISKCWEPVFPPMDLHHDLTFIRKMLSKNWPLSRCLVSRDMGATTKFFKASALHCNYAK